MNKNNNYPIVCPECKEESNAIKCYTMPDFLLFIGIYAYFIRRTYICCPVCMRKHILRKCFTYNIITGNILWLLVVLPMGLILLSCCKSKGHSSRVLRLLENDEDS